MRAPSVVAQLWVDTAVAPGFMKRPCFTRVGTPFVDFGPLMERPCLMCYVFGIVRPKKEESCKFRGHKKRAEKAALKHLSQLSPHSFRPRIQIPNPKLEADQIHLESSLKTLEIIAQIMWANLEPSRTLGP